MHKAFYLRLAARNIGKNRRFYLPYLLTGSLMVAIFYNLCFIASNNGLRSLTGGDDVASIIGFGMWVVALFSVIFLFYINSFLIRSRKKELGLYNVLGMSRRNIGRFLLYETLITAALAIGIGVIFGILVSKLLILILYKLIHFDTPFGFNVSRYGIGMSALLFLIGYLLCLLYNLAGIRLSKPVDLLHGGNIGEREPKSRWIQAVLGLGCLGTGYGIALTVESPLDAFPLFFVAVILVIAGTYLLFMAASIVFLKLLRAKKSYYYKLRHFTSVSGMLYRMKQNAAGLAGICILSTMVLVTVSTTVCMYSGVENGLDNRFPNDINITMPLVTDDEDLPGQMSEIVYRSADAVGCNVTAENAYASLTFSMARRGQEFLFPETTSDMTGGAAVTLITDTQYRQLTGREADADEGRIAVFSKRNQTKWDDILLDGKKYRTVWLEDFPIQSAFTYSALMTDDFYFVVPQRLLDSLNERQIQVYGDNASAVEWRGGFDFSGSEAQRIQCYEQLWAETEGQYTFHVTDVDGQERIYSTRVDSRLVQRESLYRLYGGFLFLGAFFGMLFLGATALIIYYKQISEGFEDQQRFEIMQKVGMTRAEIRKSINSQILTVFFLPLLTAVMHLCFAFHMISRLLTLFNLTNISLFILCCVITVSIFALVYVLIYRLTAAAYYRIVK